MAGIYFHIPFCKQACHYCDFHFSTSLKTKEAVLASLKMEIISRKDELEGQTIETIYFGGGTPSILEVDEIKILLETIYSHYKISNTPEITLEANPDDLTEKKLKALKETFINRFSIGVQSFFDEDLLYMNRAHQAQDAERSIKASQDAGFENITIDLIYGTPSLTDQNWLKNLSKAIDFQVPHISCYALTVEEKTPLASLIKRKKLALVNDSQIADQFLMMIETLTRKGFEQYEISNFARPGFYSRHNSNYWAGVPYLGFGPGAHSFNGLDKRRWNVSNNVKYFQWMDAKEKYFDEELLSERDRYNEFVMTQIRLAKGISLSLLVSTFGKEKRTYIMNQIEKWGKELYTFENNSILLSNSGKIISDKLASDLFLIN